jgi:serine/threonine-protein kinase
VLRLTQWTLVTSAGERPVTAPAHYEDLIPPGDATYALRTTVAVPQALRGRALTLAILQLPSIAHLRVGRREAVDLRASSFDHYSTGGSQAWRITPEEADDVTIDLTITVARTWFESDWLNTAPTLSATSAGDLQFVVVGNLNRLSAEVAVAFTVLMAFTYGSLYALDRRRVAALWLALQGFFGVLYPLGILGLSQPVLGTADVAVAAVSLTLATICSLHFLYAITNRPRPSLAWWLFAVAAAVAALVWHDPLRAPNRAAIVGVVTLVCTATRTATLLFRSDLTKGARVPLIGFPLAVLVGIPDITAVLGVVDYFGGFRGGALAFTVLSLTQALFLSRDHDNSLRRADELNAALSERLSHLARNNEEIRVLHGELRRQIIARSERLAEALARIGPMLTPHGSFADGEVVDERYRIVCKVGEGGMGVVYQAERLADGKVFALKVLHAARTGPELARLAREAEVAARVDHPNVVRIVDLDVARSGALFIVMDYIDGASLDALRGSYGDLKWAISILRQLASGLAALHEQEIVHRDLKPANVLVEPGLAGGSVAKIADFGIARIGVETTTLDGPTQPGQATRPRDEGEERDEGDLVTLDRRVGLTQTGQILGTPIYMAPELVHGAKLANAASDVYSFGVIAREVLTGKLPDGFELLLHLRRTGVEIPPISSVVAALTPDLGALLDACLARDPTLRPPAKAMADALRVASRASADRP